MDAVIAYPNCGMARLASVLRRISKLSLVSLASTTEARNDEPRAAPRHRIRRRILRLERSAGVAEIYRRVGCAQWIRGDRVQPARGGPRDRACPTPRTAPSRLY